MSFGRKLHDLRVANRMSLQDVANAVSMSKAHVWNLEKGLSENPSIELVVKLANLFRVRVPTWSARIQTQTPKNRRWSRCSETSSSSAIAIEKPSRC